MDIAVQRISYDHNIGLWNIDTVYAIIYPITKCQYVKGYHQ